LPGGKVGPERTLHGRSGHASIVFLNPAYGHTQVQGFDNHSHPLRMEQVSDYICNLAGHALLHLEATGKEVHFVFRSALAEKVVIKFVFIRIGLNKYWPGTCSQASGFSS
jgi:hypothetical protein